MELKLDNGKYVCGDRGFPIAVTGDEELLARALFKLTARRGQFPFLPELGSRLYTLDREKKANLQNAAAQYVMEALSDERELEVSDVSVEDAYEELKVTVELLHNGNINRLELLV